MSVALGYQRSERHWYGNMGYQDRQWFHATRVKDSGMVSGYLKSLASMALDDLKNKVSGHGAVLKYYTCQWHWDTRGGKVSGAQLMNPDTRNVNFDS